MRPLNVVLLTPPLVGTMGRSEIEVAAALLVRTLQVTGNTWRGVTPKEVGDVLAGDLHAECEPVTSWNRNPFIMPDFPGLLQEGFTKYSDPESNAMEFTAMGLKAIERWGQGGDRETV